MRARLALLVAAAGLSLSGCAYGDLGIGAGYGDPYGYGYGPYGGYGTYAGYGYGSPYFGYGYGSPYLGGYYGSPYGWYDNYYYPGTGYYVYDSYRRPSVWTDTQRRYWTQRVQRYRSTSGTTTTATRPDWSGFSRRSDTRSSDWKANREQRVQAWQQRQSARFEAQSERTQARSDRTQARLERQSSSNHGRHNGNRKDDE